MPDIAFERVLPDTNVWLDAAFCPDSVARRALTILRAAGLPLYLEDLTEREAISVLNPPFASPDAGGKHVSGFLQQTPNPRIEVAGFFEGKHVGVGEAAKCIKEIAVATDTAISDR